MYRYPDGTIKRVLPATINDNGAIRYSKDMTAEQLDAVGYNVALRMDREPFITYTTEWVKDGLVYREQALTAVVDEVAAAAAAAVAADQALKAQIAALEAMQTPRLLREAMLGLSCTVYKPGCCIDGMTPAAAMAHIDAQADILRAQLTGDVYYQSKPEG